MKVIVNNSSTKATTTSKRRMSGSALIIIVMCVVVLSVRFALSCNYDMITTFIKCNNNNNNKEENGIILLYHDVNRHSDRDTTSAIIAGSRKSLYPGELPGYTGWVRPEETFASRFEITNISSSSPLLSPWPNLFAKGGDNADNDSDFKRPPVAMMGLSVVEPLVTKVGEEWFVTVACPYNVTIKNYNTNNSDVISCHNGGSHFYVRAYGPATISGQVNDNHDGSYNIRLVPLDPGQYTVEVVLSASFVPDFGRFPLDADDDPPYEGFMLPGFPLQLNVVGDDVAYDGNSNSIMSNSSNSNKKKLCSFDELVVQDGGDSNSPYEKGRWVVIDKLSSKHHGNVKTKSKRHFYEDDPDDSLLRGYQTGRNSLGISMEYQPKTCSVVQQEYVNPKSGLGLMSSCLRSQPTNIHIIFIGDSNSRMQKLNFDKYLAGLVEKENGIIRTTLISTKGGIVRTFDDVKTALNDIENDDTNEKRFILFNTGLHDVAQLCSNKWKKERLKYLQKSDVKFSCVKEYRTMLIKLVEYISSYPADVKVFQSTTAGWPRYGNFGFGWSPSELQPFTLSSNFVDYFNKVAYDVIKGANKNNDTKELTARIHIMDGYWITLPRPDNREIDSENKIGPHLVHPGVEVLDTMGRIWWMMIVQHLCPNALGRE